MGRFQPMLAFDLLMVHTLLGSFRPLITSGPLLACSPNGPNSAHGKSQPVTGMFPKWAKFGPWQESARYWPVTLMGQIRPMARVGPFLAC